MGITINRRQFRPPISRLKRRTPCETQTEPAEREIVNRSSSRCQRRWRSATRRPPTTHGCPAQGAAKRAARLAWNRKLCTSSGRHLRKERASRATTCIGRRRLHRRHSQGMSDWRRSSASRPSDKATTVGDQRPRSSRVTKFTRARSAPPTSRSVMTSAIRTGVFGAGRELAVARRSVRLCTTMMFSQMAQRFG